MPSFTQKFELTFRRLLPSPLAIAFILTAIAYVTAYLVTKPSEASSVSYLGDLALMWKDGLWQSGLLAFTVQMMLILVLGHILALSPLATRIIDSVVSKISNGAQAAVVVGILTMLVGLFNWGLGLIFGAILARKVAESAHHREMKISYPLIGAAGYAGMMVWHGGISGSAPLKANQAGHIAELTGQQNVPAQVMLDQTIFSSMNAFATIAILMAVGITLWLLSKNAPASVPPSLSRNVSLSAEDTETIGAEHIDKSPWTGTLVGILFLLLAVYSAIESTNVLGIITPDYINFILLGLAFLAHRSLRSFSQALEEAIGGSAGILIQFPLYFGILGLVRDSGLVSIVATSLIENSTAASFPFTTLLSSGLINIFVPSGGGQWAIQGPLLVEASQSLNVPLGKSIMAMAYGDQLTNMLQPFWALPLLGITKLKARDILPYTLILMAVGTVVYGVTLAFF
ncbi:MAG: short-chain fatty acid transporter [Flavobacteriia bacterium]|nr:short-chain fatty acid transporter [Flavobacteriia bacterium]